MTLTRTAIALVIIVLASLLIIILATLGVRKANAEGHEINMISNWTSQ